MRKHAEILFFHSAGWVFIVSGVAAGFVPFVPGVVLIIVGIYIISLRSAWLKRKLDFFRKYFPGFDRVVANFENRAEKIWASLVRLVKSPLTFFSKSRKINT